MVYCNCLLSNTSQTKPQNIIFEIIHSFRLSFNFFHCINQDSIKKLNGVLKEGNAKNLTKDVVAGHKMKRNSIEKLGASNSE